MVVDMVVVQTNEMGVAVEQPKAVAVVVEIVVEGADMVVAAVDVELSKTSSESKANSKAKAMMKNVMIWCRNLSRSRSRRVS